MSQRQTHSMTGYGAASFSVGERRYEVELKSVNHRFLDLRFHLPRGFLVFEEELTRRVKARIARGHVEISVRSQAGEDPAAGFSVDLDAARVTLGSLRSLQSALGLPDAPTLSLLSGFREIFIPREVRPDASALREALFSSFEEALSALVHMRTLEGNALFQELQTRLSATRSVVAEIEARAPVALQQRQQRVSARVESLLQEAGRAAHIEGLAERLAVELALLAERADITEELARLHAHLGQFSETLQAQGPHGKRLDFLVQELHREANTLGAKSQDPELGRSVVSLKAEVERLREQIQNVE